MDFIPANVFYKVKIQDPATKCDIMSLTFQALEDSDSGPGAHQHWSFPAARKWLLERQNADGGWGDVAKTAAAVAALTPASLAAVRPPHCSDKLLDSRHEPLGENKQKKDSLS